MTVTGLLMWGQAGSYDAISDREVITALADNRVGVQRRPTFSAGSGMTVNVSPFRAIVSTGDGTACVVATHDPVAVIPAAGPASGSRTDVVWIDVDPDAAQWSLALVPEVSTVGRLGVRLGTITVPANANLASQCTFALVPVGFQSITNRGVVGGGGQFLGPYDNTRSVQLIVGTYAPTTNAQGEFNMGTIDFNPSCILGAIVSPVRGQAGHPWLQGRLCFDTSTLDTLRFQVWNMTAGGLLVNAATVLSIAVFYQARIA
jgi:hypothetical protein